ncbi:hypothetical protein [Methanolobus profundi]|nr:hypothetical protein [Methanolobus profundi]
MGKKHPLNIYFIKEKKIDPEPQFVIILAGPGFVWSGMILQN